MIKILMIIAVMGFSMTLTAKEIKGVVKDPEGIPVPGAHVYWAGTSTGVTTDENGAFGIFPIPDTDRLVVSFLGFKSDTVSVGQLSVLPAIVLESNTELNEVVVTHRNTGVIHSRLSPLQTQKITAAELGRAACCSLAESFETNPSVDVSYSDAATGARQIRLLGLSGTYVQMLTEQVPNLRGMASLYGLNYIPGPWMESIQVSKGTSSVKNGYESLTGQINVEYKKPQFADLLTVNLFGSHLGRLEANADAAFMLNDRLATGVLLHYSNDLASHDRNGDGFLDMPRTQQFNGMNRWYYKNDRFISQTAAQVIYETRESGQDVHHAGETGMPRYGIDITTKRGVLYTKNGYILNPEKNRSVALILSGSVHDQQSVFGRTAYNADQYNAYASLLYEEDFTSRHRISAGASFNYDRYSEKLDKASFEGNGYPFSRTETVPGAFVQYTFNLDDKLVVLAGLRGDYHNRYGFFVTPRLHVKYDIASFLTARLSAGKGFRTVNELAENSFLLASSRKIRISPDLDRFEQAWNYGASLSSVIPLAGRDLTLGLEWYYTDFNRQVVTDLETAHEVSFYNLDGRSYAQNVQVEVSYPFFRGFTLTAAYRYTDAKTTYRGELREKPLTGKYKAMATASYRTPLGKWQFDLTGSFNGPGRLPDPDLSVKEAKDTWNPHYSGYVLLNAQVTRYFRNWSVYIGGENLTGYTQKNPIIGADNPWGEFFDASMIYAPVHGAKFYAGIRWTIPKKED